MQLLPEEPRRDSESQSGDASEDARGGDDAEEVPQSAREPSGIELYGEEPPRERRGPDEPDEKAEVGRDVLDGRAAQAVELRDDCRAPCRIRV